MHKLFGEIPDRKCKECQYLVSYTANRKYYKCDVYGNTSSEASEWRLKWTACGMIDIPIYDGAPIINQVRLLNWRPKEKEQIEGQLVLDEFCGICIPEGAWTKEIQEDCWHFSMKFKAGESI